MISNCPICKENKFSLRELDSNLQANECGKCNGVFIGAMQYDQWLSRHGVNLPEKAPDKDVTLVTEESHSAKLCPECKYILIKYKVGHETGFAVNRCGHCGGMWLDKNEWESLKSRNLHDDINLMFSDTWQSKVRAEEHEKALDEIIRGQLGAADYEEIRRIKSWIQKHPKSNELYAYLLRSRGGK